MLCGHTCKTAAQLGFEDFLFTTAIPFLKRLTHANNRAESASEGGVDFFVNHRIRLAKDLAAFAVAQNHKTDEKFAQHGRADLASEGSRHLGRHILRAEADFLRSTKKFGKLSDGGEWRSNNDFHAIDGLDMGAEIFQVALRLSDGHVHFPISGDNLFTHIFDKKREM